MTKISRREYLKQRYYKQAEKKKRLCKLSHNETCRNCIHMNLSTSAYCKKHSFHVSFAIVCDSFTQKQKEKSFGEIAKDLIKNNKTEYLERLKALINEA